MSDRPFIPRDRDWHPPSLHPPYRSTVKRAPAARPLAIAPGRAEVSGPVFAAETLHPLDHDLIANYAAALGVEAKPIGERLIVHGRVLDENARPIPDCLIEIWQANAGGRYRHVNDSYLAPLDPAFGGCGRCITDGQGRYAFRTIKPGPYPWPNGDNEWRPAHIHLSIFGHALSQRLVTQLYFEGDPLIALCPIVNAIPDQAAVDQLVARLDMAKQAPFDALAYRFDIVLRGRRQTYFENKREGG
ncbi:MAG: protocatechuate 3,4-dioxygenase subunit beta [Neomegalonema sp.]